MGSLAGHRVLICDRDRKWTDAFRRIVQGAGVRIVLTPVQAPNANAYAERFVRSIRDECLDRLILFGERRLLRALDEFVAHDGAPCHAEPLDSSHMASRHSAAQPASQAGRRRFDSGRPLHPRTPRFPPEAAGFSVVVSGDAPARYSAGAPSRVVYFVGPA